MDASYNAHVDCKGHTGEMMSLGKGNVLSNSIKHRFNVRSSIEGELLVADYILCCVLWGKYFIESQGYTVHINVLFQLNKYTMIP